MLRGLAICLVENGKITTTLERARALRSFLEPLITLGKKGDLSARRLVLRRLPNKDSVNTIFEKIAPVYKERNGGYIRIIKAGFRAGDNAKIAIIELVDNDKIKQQHKEG
jgi:large subunit ribosomal protein L17